MTILSQIWRRITSISSGRANHALCARTRSATGPRNRRNCTLPRRKPRTAELDPRHRRHSAPCARRAPGSTVSRAWEISPPHPRLHRAHPPRRAAGVLIRWIRRVLRIQPRPVARHQARNARLRESRRPARFPPATNCRKRSFPGANRREGCIKAGRSA